jgi:hypothetical protein
LRPESDAPDVFQSLKWIAEDFLERNSRWWSYWTGLELISSLICPKKTIPAPFPTVGNVSSIELRWF